MHSYAKEYFNPSALSNIDDNHLADLNSLDHFSSAGSQLPGIYNVTVIMNDKVIGTRDIDFVFDDNNKQLAPVLTKKMLNNWGVDTDVIPTLKNLPDDASIVDIGSYIEYATTQFIFSKQKLQINIPQIALNVDIRDRINPELFNQGMPAFILNYDFSGAKTWYKNNDVQDDRFLNLRSGLNLGAWRLRNYSTYDDNSHWNSINTFLERDIQPLNSQLTMGDTNTDGMIFEGFQFRGVKLASDESMLPYSLRGFAPVVRGFAESNAKVIVRQSGSIIYQTYVAPGPFALTDLYPTSYSGNLDVTVIEEDGRKNSFVVPFASLAIMQREGGIKYSSIAGRYRSESDYTKEPDFIENTLVYGLPWNTTVYGGALLSSDYKSYASGIGFNLGDIGAVSFDVKHAGTKFDFDSKKKQGQAYRSQYSKTVQSTDSTISLEATHYSSKDFYDFNEANEKNYLNLNTNKRSRYQANLSQSLGPYGSFYLSGYQQNYWRSSRKEQTFNTGYNIVLKNISLGLSYGYTKSRNQRTNSTNQVSFRINIPLDGWLPGRNYLTTSVTSSDSGNTTYQTGLSGNTLENKLAYSVQQNYEQKNHNNGGNASVNYEGSNGSANLGYGYTENSKRLNYGVQGGVVVHPHGVTLSQTLGDTIAVIAAPGVSNASLRNTQGVETNRWGYAVKPYLTPYAENNITLNLGNLSDNVDIVNNNATVIPTKGAVVLAKIDTQIGFRVLMALTHNDSPLPFGAVVTLADGKSNGIVGDAGEVYLSGMPAQGEIVAKWGGATNQMCKANYSLTDDKAQASIKFIATKCT